MTDSSQSYGAVVVGSGPNGLAAAIRLAQAGLKVVLLEGASTIGGGSRSAELTLPGFVHDVCSAVHPLGLGSLFFRQLQLEKHGLEWVQPELPLAHPLEAGCAAALHRSVQATAADLAEDDRSYVSLMGPLVSHWETLAGDFLKPPLHIPERPLLLGRFGWLGLRSAARAARSWFRTEPARALFAGLAAHSFLSLNEAPSAAFGLVLGMLAHAVGWPSPRGGSQRLADALAAVFTNLGGEIRTGAPVQSARDLPPARLVLLDISTPQLLRLGGNQLPGWYRNRIAKFRYGPGVFKVDYALEAPIPWLAESCRRAGTVHVCGSFEEVLNAEEQVARGQHAAKPFVLVAQPTLFDSSRAPQGKHIAWAYCHVPNGSTVDMTEALEAQIERFAPGFRRIVLARHTANCAQLERANPNLIGGAIDGGLATVAQMLARPILSPAPYRIPIKGWYLSSASTPPGGGVHGMCGFHAAETALRDWF